MIPGATGGDVVRGVQMARESPERKAPAVLSVLVDRVIGLSALMLIGVVGLFVLPAELKEQPLLSSLQTVLIGILVGIGTGFVLLRKARHWRHRTPDWLRRVPGFAVFRRLTTAFWTMERPRRTLLASLALSFVTHGLFVATAICLARALTGVDQNAVEYLFLVPLGQLAFSLPITPGGAGVGQWAYEELFSAVGQPFGAELGVLLQLTAVGWGLLGALAFLSSGKPRRALTQTKVESRTG